MDAEQIIADFLRPDKRIGGQEVCQIIQTHISIVILTKSFAYKIKKPVALGFVDYSHLQKRQYYCNRELELNRRLAPAVYVDVEPLYVDSVMGINLEGKGSLCDYAVKMHRLEATGTELLTQGRLTSRTMKDLAHILFTFHQRQKPRPEVSANGEIESIRKIWSGNFQQASFFTDSHAEKEVDQIRRFVKNVLQESRVTFETRREGGFIRDGHGDFRLDNIGFLNGEPQIFDCIEFNDAFRFIDVASEVAFLVMDLEFQGHQKLAEIFLEEYQALSKDVGLYAVLNFYETYRAFVRGKVEAIRSSEAEIPESDRRRAHERALAYFRFAAFCAASGQKKPLVVFCGKIGSGKSTMAAALGNSWGLSVISSDRTRKELAGIPPGQRSPEGLQQGLYSEEQTHRTYEEMVKRAAKSLADQDQGGVLLDATFSKRWQRAMVISLAEKFGLETVFIECQCDRSVVRKRLQARELLVTTVSDGRWAIYDDWAEGFEELDEIAGDRHLLVNTALNLENNVMDAGSFVYHAGKTQDQKKEAGLRADGKMA